MNHAPTLNPGGVPTFPIVFAGFWVTLGLFTLSWLPAVNSDVDLSHSDLDLSHSDLDLFWASNSDRRSCGCGVECRTRDASEK